MGNLAIIPARGGSKRIPRKNIKNFLGKPIIAYSIEAALKSKLFDEVMVSTDDEEIAKIALKYGANIPFKRSQINADDHATTVDVILEVLEEYERKGDSFENACCIYPCAPFVSPDNLCKAFNLLNSKAFETVFPVLSYSFPIQRAMRSDIEGRIKLIYPEYLTARSQDLEKTFHDAGQFYFFKTQGLKSAKKLWTNNTGFIEINELHAQDIDNKTDWKLAELKYNLMLEDEKKDSI